MSKKVLRICPGGHRYFKSSDCPTCPICENQNKPKEGFLSMLSASARRTLVNSGITTVENLSQHTEREIMQMHGMGPASLPNLRAALKAKGLTFKKG